MSGFGLVVEEHTLSTEKIHLHRQMYAIKRLFSSRRFHNFNRYGMSASRAVGIEFVARWYKFSESPARADMLKI